MLASQRKYILDLIETALKDLGGPSDCSITLERPKQLLHGDVSTNIALKCSKQMGTNPRELATKLVERINELSQDEHFFSKVEIAGPGFINFSLSSQSKQKVIEVILREGANYGESEENKGKKVLLEYVSANPTGPLHLGHARQAALGDVLAKLLSSQGWDVTREFYYNDAGNQINTLTLSVQARAKQKLGQPADLPPDGYHGNYINDIAQNFLDKLPITTFDGNKVEASGVVEDSESVRRYSVAFLRNEQHHELESFGVSFDNYYLESSLYTDGRVEAAVKAIIENDDSYEEEGALWFKSSKYGDDKDRVMRKKDGSYTYFVPDVAYHLAKFERGFDRAINIQGTDHFGTVARVRAGLQSAAPAYNYKIPKNFPEYLLHTMLHIVKDGQYVKMSKRSGSYVTLLDLIEEIGKDAARLFLVSRKADAEFDLDLDLARRQSDDNPVYYLQYAHARICSVLSQAQEKGFSTPKAKELTEDKLKTLTSVSELNLMNKLADFPEAVKSAAEDLAPHTLVNYLKELSALFHTFYNDQRVLVDEPNVREARLALCLATRQVLRNGLSLLGISAPERLSREGN